jgi:sugar O-acyltransferase (sialic acid O-acetyltransferase NeuD family)
MILIAGAGGHAREVWDIVSEEAAAREFVFFDDVSGQRQEWIPADAGWIGSRENISRFFPRKFSFIIAMGGPYGRYKVFNMLNDEGGEVASVIAKTSVISRSAKLLQGVNVMHNCIIQSCACIGIGALLNAGSILHHDSSIGDFSEIGPGTIITGGCHIGSFTMLGAGVVLKPKVRIGGNCIIGAGSVVTKDIPDNVIAYGVPAKIEKGNTR